jgi:hypothetical protein
MCQMHTHEQFAKLLIKLFSCCETMYLQSNLRYYLLSNDLNATFSINLCIQNKIEQFQITSIGNLRGAILNLNRGFCTCI